MNFSQTPTFAESDAHFKTFWNLWNSAKQSILLKSQLHIHDPLSLTGDQANF